MNSKPVIVLLLALVFSSCNTLPYVKYYRASKEGEFPKFKEKEYLAGSNNIFRSSYDVTYYNLTLDVNTDKKYLKGDMVIHFEIKNVCDEILLDLHKAYKVQKITCNKLIFR
ncbi:MAG: hypothetical protein JEZ09_14165 [Salinivirgaceae bacterium]|nr:hypothetical protein [Salinivirgaceae bacterium]